MRLVIPLGDLYLLLLVEEASDKESYRVWEVKVMKSGLQRSIAQLFQRNCCYLPFTYFCSVRWYDLSLKKYFVFIVFYSLFLYLNPLCFCPSSDTTLGLNRKNIAGTPRAGKVEC